MTWTATLTIPAGEQFEPTEANVEVEEKYQEDALIALDLVAALDGDEDVERLVSLTGYRSGTTNSITVAVTQRPNAG